VFFATRGGASLFTIGKDIYNLKKKKIKKNGYVQLEKIKTKKNGYVQLKK